MDQEGSHYTSDESIDYEGRGSLSESHFINGGLARWPNSTQQQSQQ
jgi:hypothetical protein